MSKRKGGPGRYVAYLVLAGIALFIRRAPQFMKDWPFKAILVFAYYGWRSRTALAREHCAIAFPHLSEEKRKKIVFDSYMNLAAFCTEFCLMSRITKNTQDDFVGFIGFDIFDEAYRRGKGVILVWAHFDNFEWVNFALAVRGYPVYSLIREVDNVWLDRATNAMREVSGQKIIKRDGSAAEIIKRLREGAVVTIATDQNAMYNSVYVRFFGRWAATIKSPAVLHLRTGAPIIPVYSTREKNNSHTAHFLPEVKVEPSGDLKKDVVRVTQAISDVQARFITERPEFWLWLHRRWKIQPNEIEREYHSAIIDSDAPKENRSA